MPTIKHLSYAGITLPLATPKLERIVAELNPTRYFTEADFWNFDSPLHTTRVPTPPLPQLPEFALGRLHWPTGASRPAWFHQVVTTSILDSIRDVVGNPGSPQDLYISDGRTGHEVTASMYMLPARPLGVLGSGASDTWLLTLTDQRFYWYFRRTSVTAAPVSWAGLYAAVGNALGVQVINEPVDASYGVPSDKWVGYYQPSPPLLDAIATQVGQRIVVGLDGVVRALNWETAQSESNTQVTNGSRLIMGGTIPPQDIARYVPASVNVLFRDNASDTVPHTVNVTLGSLAITDYGAYTGLAGFSQILYADTPYDGTNTAVVNAYATAAAEDWYGWRLADADVAYPHIEPWAPTGWEDAVEWTTQLRERAVWEVENDDDPEQEHQQFMSTVVRRGPWTDFTSGGTPETTPQTAPCGWVAGLASGDCLTFSISDPVGACSSLETPQLLRLEYDTGTGHWISTTNFVSTGSLGTGSVEFWKDQGEVRLTVVGEYGILVDCDDGCLTYSLGGPLLCSGTHTPCSDWFQASVCCGCATYNCVSFECVDPGDGTGTFSTLADCQAACSPVTTVCCPDNPIPSRLYVTFSGADAGTCNQLNGLTLTLDYTGTVAGVTHWAQNCISDSLVCPGCPTPYHNDYGIDLYCRTDGVWVINLTSGDGSISPCHPGPVWNCPLSVTATGADSMTCSPFLLTFFVIGFSLCCASAAFTATVTDTPP